MNHQSSASSVLLCLRHVHHHQNGAVPLGRCALRKQAASEGGASGSASGRRGWTAQAGGASGRRERVARSDGVQTGRHWDAIGAISAPGPLGWLGDWEVAQGPRRLPGWAYRLPGWEYRCFTPVWGALRTRTRRQQQARRAKRSKRTPPPRAARGAAPRVIRVCRVSSS